MRDINNSKYYYECLRCNYQTIYTSDIKRHILKKKKCDNINNINLSENDILNNCLKKIYKITQCLENNENNIKDENNENNILAQCLENNENNILAKCLEKNKDQNILCEYCNNKYSTKHSLSRHIKICKNNPIYVKEHINDLINKNCVNLKITNLQELEVKNSLIENNNNNNICNQNIQKEIIPFFEKFDTSHINNEIKMGLLLSHLYHDTLKEILKNPVNLNYMLDLNEKNGLIYKNKNECIISIDNLTICNHIWKKVYDFLIDILEDLRKKYDKIDIYLYNHLYNQIKNKYTEFIKGNNKEYNELVIITINKLSEEKKKETQKLFTIQNNKYYLENSKNNELVIINQNTNLKKNNINFNTNSNNIESIWK